MNKKDVCSCSTMIVIAHKNMGITYWGPFLPVLAWIQCNYCSRSSTTPTAVSVRVCLTLGCLARFEAGQRAQCLDRSHRSRQTPTSHSLSTTTTQSLYHPSLMKEFQLYSHMPYICQKLLDPCPMQAATHWHTHTGVSQDFLLKNTH